MKFRNDEEVYDCQYLCEKPLKEFPGQLKTIKRSKKEGNVLCHYNLDENEAYVKASNENIIVQAANLLKELIIEKASTVKDLSSSLTASE
jgi:hypothetical protein